jgi:hypothetical protein
MRPLNSHIRNAMSFVSSLETASSVYETTSYVWLWSRLTGKDAIRSMIVS